MRFSLRSLLLAAGVVAFLAAVCFAFPVWLANCVMAPLPLILPGVYVVGLIYGPKKTRPFYIGAISAFVVQLLSFGNLITYVLAVYAEAVERVYERIGQPQELSAEFYGVDATGPMYVWVLITAMMSVASGLVCLGVWSVLWKEREERRAD